MRRKKKNSATELRYQRVEYYLAELLRDSSKQNAVRVLGSLIRFVNTQTKGVGKRARS